LLSFGFSSILYFHAHALYYLIILVEYVGYLHAYFVIVLLSNILIITEHNLILTPPLQCSCPKP